MIWFYIIPIVLIAIIIAGAYSNRPGDGIGTAPPFPIPRPDKKDNK